MAFFKRIFKGIAAVASGGIGGAFALATKKGIQRRRAKKAAKRGIDNIQANANALIDGDAAYYHAELMKKKAKTRGLFAKMKKARIEINRGATEGEALRRVGLSTEEVNQPKENFF